MKKFIAVLLSIVLLLSVLSGCGSGKSQDGTAPSAPADKTDNGGAKTDTDSGAKTDTDSGEKTDTDSEPAPTNAGTTSPKANADGKVVIRIGMDTVGRLIEGTTPLECNPATYLLYDQIFKTDPWTKKPVSDCLEDWYWEDDLTLIMKLYDDVTFSNGEPATAEDILFSYKSLEDRGSTFTNDMFIDFANSEIRDDHTLAMKFTQSSGQIFYHYISLYDKSWCEAQPDWDDEAFNKPVGSGPYEAAEYVYNDHIVMKLRDDYWNKNAEPCIVDEVYIKQYADVSSMMMALETGEIDLCKGGPSDYSRWMALSEEEREKANYAVTACSGGVTQYISFDFGSFGGLWGDNINLRRAIGYGMDLDAIGVYLNGELLNRRTYGFASPESDYYYDAGHYDYNPEYAKQLLDEAGIDPSTITVKATMMTTDTYKNFAQITQYYLEQMGFKVEYEYADITAALSAWQNPDNSCFNLFYNAIGLTNFDATSSLLNAALARHGWQCIPDEGFREIYARCKSATATDEERVQANHDLQQYIWDNCLAIPISETAGVYAFNKDVLNETMVNAISMSGYYQTKGCIHASDWLH